MQKHQNIFARTEQKYIISTEQFNYITAIFSLHMRADEHGESTIHSIYYDTPDFSLIRTSVDKNEYREKIRLRSYGTPESASTVFAEMKKKYRGVTYKRRACIPFFTSQDFMSGILIPDNQIEKEIIYEINALMPLLPQVFISYDRQAFFSTENPDFRVTFDRNILWRTSDLRLDSEVYGTSQLPCGKYIMEIKTPDVMPVWTAKLLSDICAYPSSHSKYGTAYKNIISSKETGGKYCA